jgi:outer membrane protein assembly factor BamB
VNLSHAAELTSEYTANWPEWRGPWHTGSSPTADPPVHWSETSHIKWKVAIPGNGNSTPAVWGEKIFVISAAPLANDATPENSEPADAAEKPEGPPKRSRGGKSGPISKQQFVVLCLDRATGKTLWQKVAVEAKPHEAGHQTNTFASSSPVTNGKLVFAHFGSRGLYCYDVEGNLLWSKDFGKMQTRNAFGEGSSPALYEDTLVVPWDSEQGSYITALHAKTGEPIWKQERDEHTTWATPLIVPYHGRVQVISLGTNRVRSYDLATGELMWACGGLSDGPIPTPIAGDGVVYCMSGFRGFAVMSIPLNAQGDITDTDQVVWTNKEAGPYTPSAVLHGGQLYFAKSNDGVLVSLDAKTGQTIIKPTRIPEMKTIYSSPVAAKDRVYFTSREGTTQVFRAGDKMDILATNQLDDTFDASPVLLGKELFLRGKSSLYCIREE